MLWWCTLFTGVMRRFVVVVDGAACILCYSRLISGSLLAYGAGSASHVLFTFHSDKIDLLAVQTLNRADPHLVIDVSRVHVRRSNDS